jgi:hypothetical protein
VLESHCAEQLLTTNQDVKELFLTAEQTKHSLPGRLKTYY